MASLAELLTDQVDDLAPEVRRPVQLLIESIQRLRRLVVELLELARLDAHEGAPPPAPGPGAGARRAAAGLDEKLVQPDMVVDRDLRALGDRFRFHRVVTNVVENAQRHGGGVVLVRAYARDDRCVIEVDDDGPGIPAAELDGIFDRFHKVDRSRSSHGSGLGLAIAREHARALGGSLQAENCERGARFVFTLPRATAA